MSGHHVPLNLTMSELFWITFFNCQHLFLQNAVPNVVEASVTPRNNSQMVYYMLEYLVAL